MILRALALSPAASRIIPFAVYIAFLVLETNVSDTAHLDTRWIYAVKIICVAAALGVFWRSYSELHVARDVSGTYWALSVFTGLVVFVLWIVLSQPWGMIGKPSGWDPTTNGEINWTLAAVRLTGAAVIVPVMEELFWRSFIMRWMKNPDFLRVRPRDAGAMAFVLSSVFFALEHHQWLAGLLAGLAYGAIYMRSGNLWCAVLAHAVTNLVLGVWVLHTAEWQFW
jgi:uncharacterized protein